MGKIEIIEENIERNMGIRQDLQNKIDYNEQKYNSLLNTCLSNTKNPLTEDQILQYLSKFHQ